MYVVVDMYVYGSVHVCVGVNVGVVACVYNSAYVYAYAYADVDVDVYVHMYINEDDNTQS